MQKENSASFLGDLMIGFNMAGIFLSLIISIWQRAKLVKEAQTLDHDNNTPSDYALLISNLDLSAESYGTDKKVSNKEAENFQEKLKKYMAESLEIKPQKIVYVNLCYQIDDIIQFNQQLNVLDSEI